jgi:prepilin-type N-terminal cleavage/methylation domain-containing protein
VTNQRGFSLIEVIAAMIILSVGIIGMAASTTAVQNMTLQGQLTGRAAAVAGSRFDVLRATPCASLGTSGTATTQVKFAEKWSITTSGTMRLVVDSVSYTFKDKLRKVAFSTVISCAAIIS